MQMDWKETAAPRGGLGLAGEEPDLTVLATPARRRPGRPTLSNEELLDKALDQFLEKGFAGTSIDAICAAAGMAKRTVYARYGDKEALFKAALSRAIDEWLVPIERLQALETGDLEATLQRIGAVLVENVLGPAGLRLLRLTNAESVSMPEIASENVRRGTEPTLRYLSDLFRRSLEGPDGPYADAEEAAQAFLSIVVGGPASNAAWGMSMDHASVERHTSFCVRLFLHGLLDQAPGATKSDRGDSRSTASSALQRSLREAQDTLAEARRQIEEATRLAGEG